MIGLLLLWYFLVRGGMSALIGAGFVVLYVLLMLAMTRIRAQLGPPTNEMYGATPPYFLRLLPGPQAIGPRGFGMLALLRPFTGEQRTNPAPAQLEGLKMAERTAIRPFGLAMVMLAAGALAILCLFWANLHVGYGVGLSTARVGDWAIWVPRESSYKLDSWLSGAPTGPNWPGVSAVGLGFGVTALLMVLKVRFAFWPLHPVAFPLAIDYQIETMLPALIIAWLTKMLLLRYGGLRMYRRSLPLFLGFIIGNAVMMLVVALVCFAFHIPLPGWGT